MKKWLLLLSFTLMASACSGNRRPTRYKFLATAYSVEGTTKSGTETRVGIVAADTDVLPLGTQIRVTGAGEYSGRYAVTDTGANVDGKHIDIYVPDARDAKDFGNRTVRVEVLKWGDWGTEAGVQK